MFKSIEEAIEAAARKQWCFGTVAYGSVRGCGGCPVARPCFGQYPVAATALDLEIEFSLLLLERERESESAQQPAAEWKADPIVVPKNAGRLPGMYDEAPAIVVRAEDLRDSGQFQQRALDVPWPDVFLMEAGKTDYRVKHRNPEDRNKRHQIDWYRPGSYVEPMPNTRMLATSGNPYSLAIGIGATIARETYRVAAETPGPVRPTDIEDLVLASAGESANTYNRCCVRDALRDMALFGIVRRLRGGYFVASSSNR